MPDSHARPGLLRSAALVAVAAFGLGSAITFSHVLAPEQAAVPGAAQAALPDPSQPFAVSDVAEAVLPGVVSVSVKQTVQAPELPPGMHRYFDPFFDFGDGKPQQRGGEGSGVIVDAKKGIVLTNNHVVDGADEILVTLSDGTSMRAEVVGTDPLSDIGVLRLLPDGKLPKLTAVPIGDSEKLRLGEVVLAIGNPFGFSGTVTMGIVSAKGRADTGITRYGDFIQTDAAINPGNSGGALVNMRGELVGINTAIASGARSSAGIGFAIPTSMAAPIMVSLLETGTVERGYLGIQMQELSDPELAARLGAKGAQGVIVADVVPNSPAESGGLRAGDIIEEFDGVPTHSLGRLSTEVARRPAGSRIDVKVLRDGKEKRLSVTLGAQPENMFASLRSRVPSRMAPDAPVLDIQVRGLDDAARKEFSLSDKAVNGVVVSQVKPGSIEARAGLRPGDVVLEVNRERVESPEEFEARYGASESAMLRVLRGDNVLFLVIDRG